MISIVINKPFQDNKQAYIEKSTLSGQSAKKKQVNAFIKRFTSNFNHQIPIENTIHNLDENLLKDLFFELCSIILSHTEIMMN